MIIFQNIKLYRIIFWLSIVGIYILAVFIPSQNAPSISVYDKVNHMIAFAELGLLIRLGYEIGFLKSLGLLVAFGVWIEISQYFTPTRSAEVGDVVADLIGVLIGLGLQSLILKSLYR